MESLMSKRNFQELKEKGYTVVPNVISHKDCDIYVSQYKDWLKQFKNGRWPHNMYSCIQRYKIAHMEPSWKVRLASKRVFEEVWKTDQLLSSYDAVAVARPPEELDDPNDVLNGFCKENQGWLHCDQGYLRDGLHAYQSGVYLEEADEQDWTLEVLEGSHKLHNDFFEQSPRARIRSALNDFYRLIKTDTEWYNKAGCIRKRIAVPKGGMVLWDSRLIHANARPLSGRPCKDRWRFVVFVCMAPKSWSSYQSLQTKKEAYENMRMTTHWPSNDIGLMSERLPDDIPDENPEPLKELPEIAKTAEAKMLAGVIPYPNEKSSEKRGPAVPQWRLVSGKQLNHDTYYLDYKQLFKLLTIFFLFIAICIGVFVL
ncbi:uncharacterized protein LOC126827159 [Patella vulgata]|uniref:uncharacterized protein LOC126827159 n=1 Tax=Patella vulgata TaxID=6465 RepID=UPI0024A86F4A|nr:uncharacterized protein LOC126827159 [Patella vulgata]